MPSSAPGPPTGSWPRFLLFAGLALVAFALIANEWVVAALLTRDGQLGLGNRTVIWLGGIVCLLAGVVAISGARFSRGSARADFLYVARHHKHALLLVTGCLVLFAFWGLLELGFWGLNRWVKERSWVEGGQMAGFFVHDRELGYVPRPGGRVRSTKRTRERVIFDVVYTIDESGRRVTPSASDEATATAIFFGGSFTFGEGVNDDETLPHYVGEARGELAVYNFGFSGYGPQQTLALLESDRMDELLAGTEAVGIYTFIDGHVQRAAGSMRVVATWGGGMPCYGLGPDAHPRRLDTGGGFRQARPLRSAVYHLLARSQILQFLDIDYPLGPRDRDIELTARMLAESARLFSGKSGGGSFFVVFYPGSRLSAPITAYLRELGVRHLDYSNLFPRDAEHVIDGDRHPTPLAHRAMAGSLVQDVGAELEGEIELTAGSGT